MTKMRTAEAESVPPFKAGEVVFLKSGSPPLTVSDMVRPDGLVTVEWYTRDGAPQSTAFHSLCLSRTNHPQWASDVA